MTETKHWRTRLERLLQASKKVLNVPNVQRSNKRSKRPRTRAEQSSEQGLKPLSCLLPCVEPALERTEGGSREIERECVGESDRERGSTRERERGERRSQSRIQPLAVVCSFPPSLVEGHERRTTRTSQDLSFLSVVIPSLASSNKPVSLVRRV